MKYVVCGSHDWKDPHIIKRALRELPRHSTIVHGGGRGVPTLVAITAAELGLKTIYIPSEWGTQNSAAERRRTLRMLNLNPDGVIAFWRSTCTNTLHAINEANQRGIPVTIYRP